MGYDVGIFGMALGRLGEYSKFLRWSFWADQSCADQASCEASCNLHYSECLLGSDPVFYVFTTVEIIKT